MDTILIGKRVRLDFRPVTLDDIPALCHYLPMSGSRTCDFSVGGVTMWRDYFRYEMAVLDDTLFIKGVCEDNLQCPAFSMPCGKMNMHKAVGILREYCQTMDTPLVLSAIPEDRLEAFSGMDFSVDELTDWADYVYCIADLATLCGKAYGKKRNHVNRFALDNPGSRFDPLLTDDIPAVTRFYLELDNHDGTDSPTAAVEREQVFEVLRNLASHPFEGAVLRQGDGNIVAFTLGEVIGDTLFVHIEKMRHDTTGAGETINKLFAEMMMRRHPGLTWINREEDAGDQGLRRAKESYRPAMMLRKFNLTLY